MRFVYANLDQARQARARLKDAVEERLPGRKVELTLAGAALAAATGYSGWAELKKAVDPTAATPWENPGDAGAQVRDAHRAAAVAQLLDVGPVDAAAIAEAAGMGRRPLAGDRGSPAASAASRTPPTPARRTGDAPALVLADAGEERRITVAPAWAGSGLSYAADRPCVAAVVGSDLDAVALAWARSAVGAAKRSSVVAVMHEARSLGRELEGAGRRLRTTVALKAPASHVSFEASAGTTHETAPDGPPLYPEDLEVGGFEGGAPCFGPIGPDCFKDGGIGLAVEPGMENPVEFVRWILRAVLEGSSRLGRDEAWYGDEIGGLPRETLLVLRSGGRARWDDLGPDLAAARRVGASSLVLLDDPEDLTRSSGRRNVPDMALGEHVDFLVIAGAADAATARAAESWLAASRSGFKLETRGAIPETVAGEVCILSRAAGSEIVHVACATTAEVSLAA